MTAGDEKKRHMRERSATPIIKEKKPKSTEEKKKKTGGAAAAAEKEPMKMSVMSKSKGGNNDRELSPEMDDELDIVMISNMSERRDRTDQENKKMLDQVIDTLNDFND